MKKALSYILIIFAMIFTLQTNVYASSGVFAESSISIYPNPVVYEANITLDQEIDLMDNEVSLSFFNIVGEEVHIMEGIQNHKFTVNKENFKKSGIYLYQLKINGEVLKTGKISIH